MGSDGTKSGKSSGMSSIFPNSQPPLLVVTSVVSVAGGRCEELEAAMDVVGVSRLLPWFVVVRRAWSLVAAEACIELKWRSVGFRPTEKNINPMIVYISDVRQALETRDIGPSVRWGK